MSNLGLSSFHPSDQMAALTPAQLLYDFKSRLLCILPSRTAIDHTLSGSSGAMVTYQELLERAFQVYTLLLNRPDPSAPFLLSTNKSIDLYGAVLTSIFNGIPFIPIHDSWTSHKIISLIEATGANLWIGANQHPQVSGVSRGTSIRFVESDEIGAQQTTEWSQPISNKAYFMSSSGSTGAAKVVCIQQAQFFTLIDDLLPIYKYNENDRISNFYDLCFDPALVDIFLTFLQGATLVPVPNSHRYNIFSFINDANISVWSSTPSLVQINQLRLKGNTRPSLPSLRLSLFTGEALSPKIVSLWKEMAPMSDIDNLYGPIETTVWISRARIHSPRQNFEYTDIPIGHCLPSFSYALVSEDGELVTPGDIGELCVSGPQVFSGYLNQSTSQLTTFPWDKQNQIWYRTGDRVVQRHGLLYHRGRVDFQFKIAGLRVSPEDLENQIDSAIGVPSLILPLATNHSGGVGHIGVIVFEELTHDQYRHMLEWFQLNLPASLSPKHLWVHQTPPPLTSTGKLDRNALIQLAQSNQLPLYSRVAS
jgi:non-ribosomal peptide synthetase component F